MRTMFVCYFGHFEVAGYNESVMWHNFCIEWVTSLRAAEGVLKGYGCFRSIMC